MTQILNHKYIILLFLLWPIIYIFPIFFSSVFLLICRPNTFLFQIFSSISFSNFCSPPLAKYFPPHPSPLLFSNTIQICIILFQIFSITIRILLHWPNIFLLLFLPCSSFAPLTKYYPSPNIFLFFVLLCSSPPLTNMFLHFLFLCKGSSLTRSTCLFHSMLGKCSKKVVIFHDFCHKASHRYPTPPPLMALLATHFFIPLFSFAIESYNLHIWNWFYTWSH